MLALYRSGRQAEALETYRDARRLLVEDAGIEPGAELQRLHEAILRQDPSLDLPATTPAHQRSALPASPNRTVGRGREVAGVAERLRSGSVRLLTLTGPGGVGKTRLASEAARAVEPDFADGAHLVMLAAVERSQDVPGLAAVAAVRDDLDRAARLSGAAAAHRYGAQGTVDRRLDTTFFEPARKRHGAAAWDAAVREGAARGFEDALDYALDEPPPTGRRSRLDPARSGPPRSLRRAAAALVAGPGGDSGRARRYGPVMRDRRLPGAASWLLAVLAGIALTGGLVLVYAERTVFDADGFARRADAALQTEPVRAVAARRVVDARCSSRAQTSWPPVPCSRRPSPRWSAPTPSARSSGPPPATSTGPRSTAAPDRHAERRGHGHPLARPPQRLDAASPAVPDGLRDPTWPASRTAPTATRSRSPSRPSAARRLAAIALIALRSARPRVLLLSPTTAIRRRSGSARRSPWRAGSPPSRRGRHPAGRRRACRRPNATAVRAAAAVWLTPLVGWALALGCRGRGRRPRRRVADPHDRRHGHVPACVARGDRRADRSPPRAPPARSRAACSGSR